MEENYSLKCVYVILLFPLFVILSVAILMIYCPKIIWTGISVLKNGKQKAMKLLKLNILTLNIYNLNNKKIIIIVSIICI